RGLWQSVRVRPPGSGAAVTVNPLTRRVMEGLRWTAAVGLGGGSLFKEESHPEARQQRQEEGSERADQEVFGELSVFQRFEAGERLRGADPADRGVFAQQHERDGEGRPHGADGEAAGAVV